MDKVGRMMLDCVIRTSKECLSLGGRAAGAWQPLGIAYFVLQSVHTSRIHIQVLWTWSGLVALRVTSPDMLVKPSGRSLLPGVLH